MLNKIILMGRLTHDPELRRTQNGTAVTGFSLAVERDFKDEDGKRHRGMESRSGVCGQVFHQGPHGRGGGPLADP